MAIFPSQPEAPGSDGALVHLPEFYKPSPDGTLIYLLSSSDDVNDELSRVEAAGGKILMPKKQISPEIGYMALIQDSEGNRIGLLGRK
jgi:predicted enzyme related to lactoylglutathione lyase